MTSRFCHPEIASAFLGRVEAIDWPVRLQAGQHFEAEVELVNESGDKWGGSVFHPVCLGYRWVNPAQPELSYDGLERAALTTAIGPHSRAKRKFFATAPATAGNWTLEVSLAQEGQFWFHHRSDAFAPAVAAIAVDPA